MPEGGEPADLAKTIIVSGSDSGYFELLRGLILSIRDKPESAGVPVGILDLGLDGEQRAWLKDRVEHIAAPDWDVTFPGHESAPDHRKAFTARPFLRKYFPGFETYIWIDADAWLQDWSTIELLARGARSDGLAIVPEIDRNYKTPMIGAEIKIYARLPGLGIPVWKMKSWVKKRFRRHYSGAEATEHMLKPIINTGVFALTADAPHWGEWAASFHAARIRDQRKFCDQGPMNHAIYTKGLGACYLPSWCNWILLGATPAWDADSGMLVEPSLPHHPIGILHMVADTRSTEYDLRTTDGGAIRSRLRYGDIKALRALAEAEEAASSH